MNAKFKSAVARIKTRRERALSPLAARVLASVKPAIAYAHKRGLTDKETAKALTVAGINPCKGLKLASQLVYLSQARCQWGMRRRK